MKIHKPNFFTSRFLLSLFLVFLITINTFLVSFLSFPAPAFAEEALYQWTRTIGETSVDMGQGITTDVSGNVYITGAFMSSSVDFDPSEGTDPKSSNGSVDIFITKYNIDGSYAWTKTIGGTSFDAGESITTDTNGNIFITGRFSGSNVDFDPSEGVDPKSSNGGGDVFITKYNANGSYGWTKCFGGTINNYEYGSGITTDINGNIFITGRFLGSNVDFDPSEGVDLKSSNGSADIYITKYNADGSYGWTRNFGGTGDDYGYGIATNANGNIFIVGEFSGTDVDFNASESTDFKSSNGVQDIFISKYNADGSYGWTRTVGGTGTDSGLNIISDTSGNLFISGIFSGTDIDFDASSEADLKSSNGEYDMFVTKYNSDDSYGWTKTFGGTSADSAYGITTDVNANVFVSGSFYGTDVDFDPSAGIDLKSSNGNRDISITELKNNGSYGWTKIFGGTDSDNSKAITIDFNSNIYVTGNFRSFNADFDPSSGIDLKSTNGSTDIFISKYTLDDEAPAISLTALDYTSDTTPSFSGTATEALGTVLSVEYQMDETSGSWIACESDDEIFDEAVEAFACDVSPALTEGTHTIYIRATDSHTNTTASGSETSDSFIVDTTGPTGSISINSGSTITNTDEVTLTLSATDNLTEVKKMMVSNKGDYSGGTWETYNTSKEWRLSVGDGEKRVYVKYRDEVGNISSSNSDSIEMDMGAPTGTLIINEGEEYTSSREVVLHITGEDEVTGVEEMRISEERTMEGVDWEGYETSRGYTLSEGDGYKVIYIQYRDGIGNESEVYGSNITLDSNTEIDITEIGEEEVEGEIENWETEETTPTFTGEGEVGATIIIEIEGIETGTVIVNEDGVWSWTPSIELTKGQEYNVTITSTDLAGNEGIQTFILGISYEEVIEVNQTTPEAQITTTQLPSTGVILVIGLLLVSGLLWTGVNLKVIQKLGRKGR